jgi:DNA replication protein DnaC
MKHNTSTQHVLNFCNQLNLFGISKTLDYRLTEIDSENLDFNEALALLLEDETLYRKNKRFERLKKSASFSQGAHLESFDLAVSRGLSKAQLKKLESLEFLDHSQNIIIFGPTGVGKSFLAQAIGFKACQQGSETKFFSINKLFLEAEAQSAAGNTLGFLKKIRKQKILILDDFGLRNYTHEEASLLLDILEERYQVATTIITSQIKPLGWADLFEDKIIAEAILDRLINCAHIFEMKGASFRKNHKPKST